MARMDQPTPESGAARGYRTFHLTNSQLRRGYWFQGMVVLAVCSSLATLLIGAPLLWYGISTDMAPGVFASLATALLGAELGVSFLALWLWVGRKTRSPATPPGGIITVSWDATAFTASYDTRQHTVSWKDARLHHANGFSLFLLPDGACLWLFKENLPEGALEAIKAYAEKAKTKG